MGVDIHMHLIKGSEIIKEYLYDGRNYDWFANLRAEGDNEAYRYFPSKYYEPTTKNSPKEIMKDFKTEGYFGFTIVNVKELMKWYKDYRPDITAGWVSKYEAWLYDTKNIIPDEIRTYFDPEIPKEDQVFKEFVNKYEPMTEIINYLFKNNYIEGYDLIYYFDC